MQFRRKIAAFVAVVAASAFLASADAEDKKTLTVKACMKCQNTVKKELEGMAKKGDIDWEKAEKRAKVWLGAANDLGKNEPPVGGADSWKTQAENYVKNVTAVHKATADMEAKDLSKALATVGQSCGACHSKHKPK